MLRKILVAVLAAQLTIQPVQAQSTPLPAPGSTEEKKLCKAILGADDIMLGALVAYIIMAALAAYGRTIDKEAKEKEIKDLKERAKKRCTT